MSRRSRWFRLLLLAALLSTAAGSLAQASAAPSPRPGASNWRAHATGPGKYIVILKPASGGVSASSVTASVASDPGVAVTRTYSHALNGFAADLSAGAVETLKGDSRVEMIVPDAKVHPFVQTIPAGAKRVGATTNPIAKIDGVDQRVNADIAILDMGVGPNNDLNIAGGVDCTDSSDPAYPTYNDVGGHGTHVAGIAAAIDNTSGIVGVAPGARIWSVRVLGSIDGSWSWVLCGIDWVTAHASTIDVANMSLGEDLGNAYPDLDNLIHNAIKTSVVAGVTYVVAAGNAGTTALKTVPAKYSEVIAVSAFCDSDGKPGGLGPRLSACADDAFASFSNFGSVVDISAPGVDTRSLAPGGGISVMSGTSFATPHVAGAAALYIAQFGRVGPAAVRAGLMAAKEQGVIPGDTDGWNEGRLNVGSLVAGTVAMGHGSGPVGDSVTVKISNFPASASVSILFDSKTVATTATDGSGAVWRKITIPDATRGSHKITAISGAASGTASFSVTASLSVSPNPNVYGQQVNFTGKGFKASETVSVSASGPTPLTIGTGKTNSAGTVSITISGPAAIGGAYTATMAGGSGSSAKRAFTVSPSLTLSTSSAFPGSTIKVSARGMQSNEFYSVNYRVAAGATRICNSKATAATGSSSCYGKIPSGAAPGSGTIELRGSKGTFLSTSFNVRSLSAASAKTATATPTNAAATTTTPVTVSPTNPSVIEETATPTQTPIPESTATPTATPTEIPSATPTETPTDIPTVAPTATDVSAAGSPPAG